MPSSDPSSASSQQPPSRSCAFAGILNLRLPGGGKEQGSQWEAMPRGHLKSCRKTACAIYTTCRCLALVLSGCAPGWYKTMGCFLSRSTRVAASGTNGTRYRCCNSLGDRNGTMAAGCSICSDGDDEMEENERGGDCEPRGFPSKRASAFLWEWRDATIPPGCTNPGLYHNVLARTSH